MECQVRAEEILRFPCLLLVIDLLALYIKIIIGHLPGIG